MFPIFTLLSAQATQSTPLSERRFGVGMTTTFSDSRPVQATGSLRWQASPRWVVEPRFGLRRTDAILDSPLVQSGTGVQIGLSARRYLASRGGVHLVGVAGIDTGYESIASAEDGPFIYPSWKQLSANVNGGAGVEWTPNRTLALSADLIIPLLQVSRTIREFEDPWTDDRVSLIPVTRISAHLYF